MGIQTATVTVEYINPPKEGKKKGSIRGTDGKYFGVFQDDLVWFKTGRTYEIKFTDDEKYGTTVKKAIALDAGQHPGPAPGPKPQQNGVGFRPSMSREDSMKALRALLCQAYAQAGIVPSAADVETLIANVTKGIANADAKTTSPQYAADMDDEVRY